jgi:GcrA cell cycle regulator
VATGGVFVMIWTEENVALLKQLKDEGLSGQEIAIEFGKLGFPLTRNAIIGKLNRLGLAQPQAERTAEYHRRRAERALINRAEHRTVRRIHQKRVRRREPEPKPEILAPDAVNVTLLELKPHHCRWPIGDPCKADFRFCGADNTGHSYCPWHSRMAYTPAPERRRIWRAVRGQAA